MATWEGYLNQVSRAQAKLNNNLVCFGRDGEGNDLCHQPGDGHVLGDITMDLHGDHGKCTNKSQSSQ